MKKVQEVNVSANDGVLNTDNPTLVIYNSGQIMFRLFGGIPLEQDFTRLRVSVQAQEKVDGNLRFLFVDNVDLLTDYQVQRLYTKLAENTTLNPSVCKALVNDFVGKTTEWVLQQKQVGTKPKNIKINDAEVQEAKASLCQKDLRTTLLNQLRKIGLIGSDSELLLLFYGIISYQTEKPLNTLLLSDSSVARYIQNHLAAIIPESDKIEITSITDQAIYHFAELNRKVLFVADVDAAKASLVPLNQLNHSGSIQKLFPKKDLQGNLKTAKVNVIGNVSVNGICTNYKALKSLRDSFVPVLLGNTDELKFQMMKAGARSVSGTINLQEQREIKTQIQNQLQVLQAVSIRNPFAESLIFPVTIKNADVLFEQYLRLVNIITYWNQYALKQKTDKDTGEIYIETTVELIQEAWNLFEKTLVHRDNSTSEKEESFLNSISNYLNKTGQKSFTAKQIENHIQENRMKVNRLIRATPTIEIIGGNEKMGYEYELVQQEQKEKLLEFIGQMSEKIKSMAEPKLKSTSTKNNTNKNNTALSPEIKVA